MHHLVGMIFLVACALFVSLAPTKEDAVVSNISNEPKKPSVPVWAALLCSVAMPVACTF